MKNLIIILAVAFSSCNIQKDKCECQTEIKILKAQFDSLESKMISNDEFYIERITNLNEMDRKLIEQL